MVTNKFKSGGLQEKHVVAKSIFVYIIEMTCETKLDETIMIY